jgi:hypothetical protein
MLSIVNTTQGAPSQDIFRFTLRLRRSSKPMGDVGSGAPRIACLHEKAFKTGKWHVINPKVTREKLLVHGALVIK